MKTSFGEFFKQKRLEKNLTQKELAKILFVSESTISKWEKDVAHPDITLLPKLSEILDVTEHELITATIDKKNRAEKSQAKKWQTLSFSWNLFFYIAYAIAIITCFVCDLAINKSLTWFWIVLSALLLAFTFTNLPKYIQKYRLILIPLSMYLALTLLLGICCIYTHGNWFWVASSSVLVGLIIIFVPILISKYKVFDNIKKFGDYISIAIDFVSLNILLIITDTYTFSNGYTNSHWFLRIGLPITFACYLLINIFLSVRFLKINGLLKTSIILFLVDLLYLLPPFLHFNNENVQREIDNINIFKANFSKWIPELTIANNVHIIIALCLLGLSISFLIAGLIFRKSKSKNSN